MRRCFSDDIRAILVGAIARTRHITQYGESCLNVRHHHRAIIADKAAMILE